MFLAASIGALLKFPQPYRNPHFVPRCLPIVASPLFPPLLGFSFPFRWSSSWMKMYWKSFHAFLSLSVSSLSYKCRFLHIPQRCSSYMIFATAFVIVTALVQQASTPHSPSASGPVVPSSPVLSARISAPRKRFPTVCLVSPSLVLECMPLLKERDAKYLSATTVSEREHRKFNNELPGYQTLQTLCSPEVNVLCSSGLFPIRQRSEPELGIQLSLSERFSCARELPSSLGLILKM